jgi:hypothetical protein
MKKVMRNKKVMFTIAVVVLAVALLASGGVIASPASGSGDPPVASAINYQGQLTDSEGNPLDGNHDMEFRLYDSASGGSQVGSTITKNGVTVTKGQFSVKLDVDQSVFNGQGLWLEVKVGVDTLSPRQEILPVPYALSLKPGAQISGTINGPVLYVSNNGSGTGAHSLLGESANGAGVYGQSGNFVGVIGSGLGTDGIGVRGGGILFGVEGWSANGVAIRASGTGRIESTADSYIFISGSEFIKDMNDDSTTWQCSYNGGVAIWSGATADVKYIHIPITVPGVLYGQNVTVKELTIYYKCQAGTKNYISATLLYKQTAADNGVVILDDENDQQSDTATSYTLTPTGNNVLSSDQGILGLYLRLYFVDKTNYIMIGGVRLTLGHSG